MPEFDPIGTVAFFRERQRIEAATTAKVLRAMSPEMLDFRPHPQSSTVGVIAWTIVRCLCLSHRLTQSIVAEVPRGDPPSYEALLEAYEYSARDLNASLIPLEQREWESPRTVTTGNRNLLQQPLGQVLWLFHVDSIHHRGQLSVSLRPFGAKVPSIYGPSGDCQQAVSNN